MGPDLKYWIVPVVEDNEQPINESLHVSIMNKDRQPYISIPLSDQKLFQNIAIADLDGDGEYEFIIKWPDTEIDPFQGAGWRKSETTYKLDAYKLDGTLLWRFDLGWDIEMGIWYSPFVAYDFDGDGKAEIAVKTGDGDHRDRSGHVRSESRIFDHSQWNDGPDNYTLHLGRPDIQNFIAGKVEI